MNNWEYDLSSDNYGILMDTDGYTIARLAVTENTTAHRLFEKHLQLMAASPKMRNALIEIILCSQNSASSKEECGRIAREALKGLTL